MAEEKKRAPRRIATHTARRTAAPAGPATPAAAQAAGGGVAAPPRPAVHTGAHAGAHTATRRKARPAPKTDGPSWGRRLVWGLRLLLGAVAVLPLFAFMVWFNYTVDCSGLFHGDVYTREIAAMLLDGQNVDGYESMDERSLTRLLIEQMDQVPGTVALGSSRVMQMTRQVAGTEDFYNFGMTGGDFFDLLGTWYLFEEKGGLPQDVILCIDPWLLNGSGAGDTYRSDKNLYAQMLTECLGEPHEYTEADKTDLWQALVSPSYFQGNWKYWRTERRTQQMPQAVAGEAYENATTEVKNSDGSVHYTVAMRTQTEEQTAQYALDMAGTYAWCDDYTEPDPERVRLLKKYIAYMQDKGVRVYILLTPLHPVMYEYALTYPADNLGFLRSELAVRQLAADCGVPVYGSYDPHILDGVNNLDFYDGVHCTSECLEKFWPGIETARANLEAGVDPATALLDTVDNDIYAQLALRCGPDAAEQYRAELPLSVTAAAAAGA